MATLRHGQTPMAYANISDISAGSSFGMLLCDTHTGPLGFGGKLFAFGDNSKGQLGVGHVCDLYEPTTLYLDDGFLGLGAGGGGVAGGAGMPGFAGAGGVQHGGDDADDSAPASFTIRQVACGDSHALALDAMGNVYSWGGLGGAATGILVRKRVKLDPSDS